MKNMYRILIPGLMLGLATLFSCGTEKTENTLPPKITLSSTNSIYTGKIGRDILLEATVENGDGAAFSWQLDGKVIGTGSSCIFRSDESGEYYITLRVDAKGGYAEKELRVDVLEMAPPVISMAIPEGGLTTWIGAELLLSPDVQNSEGATYQWYISGVQVGSEKELIFSKSETGDYPIKLIATNEDGTTQYEASVRVESGPVLKIDVTDPVSHITPAPRTVMSGRSLRFEPIVTNAFGATYSWSVDGTVQSDATTPWFDFTPSLEKEYAVTLTVTNGSPLTTAHLSRNVVRSESSTASATYRVNCVNASNEAAKFRAYTGTESFTVMEYVAAPGQFVNQDCEATNYEEASAWAQKQLEEGNLISLGGFGGYLTVRSNHSIVSSGSYDFCVFGNSFEGSSEPGIVSVMQDENGDGLPNDTWYEVRGSESGKPETISGYALTYYRSNGDIRWSDNLGNTGSMGFISHGTTTMYPGWVRLSSYTLRGTRLQPRTVEEDGIWVNKPFDWGYADNASPTDMITTKNPMTGRSSQGNRIRISDAVAPDGKPANLRYIDFIRVHTGLNVSAGILGENSTEVLGFAALDPSAALK